MHAPRAVGGVDERTRLLPRRTSAAAAAAAAAASAAAAVAAVAVGVADSGQREYQHAELGDARSVAGLAPLEG